MKAGWQTKTLGEACKVMNGGTPKTGILEYWDGGHLWITPAEMGNRSSPYVSDTRRKITDLGLRDSSAQMLPPNSVILSSRAPIGHLVINTEPMATNQGCKGLIPGSQIQHKFLYYYLSSIVDLLNLVGTGATFKELSGGKLKEVTIPVPPLAEQRRIVGILDEAFEGIATTKANAEKNLQNARAVFESHLNAVFTRRGKGWVEQKLVDVAESISTGPFGTMLHKSDYISNGIPLVNPMNIVESRIVPSSRMMVSTETRERLCSYVLQTGDVVIGRRGDLGRCALVTDTEAGWICGTGSFFLRLSKAMDGKYFVALFSSRKFRKRLESSAVGSTMSNLNHSILKELLIPVPPIAEQESIMARADEMLCEVARLESIYQQKLAALEALKKSLLHQAFTGAL